MARYDQKSRTPGSTVSLVRETPLTVTATEAKTRFGPLLEGAIQGRTVVITRHSTAKAVLLPISEYEALTARRVPDIPELTAEFDALLASMQTPESRAAMKTAFNRSPKEMGRAAAAYHRQRG
ncbi:MAG: type II toxin-antitoxin system Phd/YefM family antitoxin [Vicinamibacterales bacterium]